MKVLLTATVQSHICQFHKPLVEVLHSKGYEVHVAARDNLAEKNGLKLDFVDKIYNVPFARSPKSKDNIKAYKILKKLIEKEKYDIVHCNTPMGGIVTRLAARKARKQGTKVYYTAHGFHFYNGSPKKNWIVYYPIEKIFSRITDKLITITQEDYDIAKNKFYCPIERIHGVGVSSDRYHPISHTEQIELKNRLGILNKYVILCVGELLPNKNQQMAIYVMKEVIKKYPDAILLLAGNGPERESLSNLINILSLNKNIKLLGYVTNLNEYQQITDVAISCSKREGLPLNIVEAMLTGTPIVASENRGHRELICDGKNGYLVSLNNVNDMSKKVIELLNNKELCNSIKERALKYAENYSVDKVKKELEKIYFA